MRQAQAKSLRQDVRDELKKRKIPWRKAHYRAAKKLYNSTPRPLRKHFSILTK